MTYIVIQLANGGEKSYGVLAGASAQFIRVKGGWSPVRLVVAGINEHLHTFKTTGVEVLGKPGSRDRMFLKTEMALVSSLVSL